MLNLKVLGSNPVRRIWWFTLSVSSAWYWPRRPWLETCEKVTMIENNFEHFFIESCFPWGDVISVMTKQKLFTCNHYCLFRYERNEKIIGLMLIKPRTVLLNVIINWFISLQCLTGINSSSLDNIDLCQWSPYKVHTIWSFLTLDLLQCYIWCNWSLQSTMEFLYKIQFCS